MTDEIDLTKLVKKIFRVEDAEKKICCDACGDRHLREDLHRAGTDFLICEKCGDIEAYLFGIREALRCGKCHGHAHSVVDGDRSYLECTHGCGWTSKADSVTTARR